MGNSPSKKKKNKQQGHNRPEEGSGVSSSASSSSISSSSSSSHLPTQLKTTHSSSDHKAHHHSAAPPPAAHQPARTDPVMSKSSSKSSITPKTEPDRNNFSMRRLEEVFEKYKENDTQIGPEGIEALCKDINVEPENVVVLVLAWHLNAQSMGYFKKEEFISGLQSLGVDSIEKLKSNLNVFKVELDDPVKFKDIYRFAFGFAKEKEQKILDLATADAMLDLVLGERQPHTEQLRQFLKEQTTYKSINLDQWMNILEFSRTIKADLSNYDENGAWPVLLDEYCEWARERKRG